MTDPTPPSPPAAADPTQDVYQNVPMADLPGLKARLTAQGATSIDVEPDDQGTYTVTATFPA